MPLPAALISTYAQYKHDTDAVASWLATTAKANGYPKPFSDDEKTPAGSARSKGKARKAPKAKKAPSTFKKYIIAIKDFVPLAEFIVGKTPPISIPASFNTTIDRVIAARGGFANDLAGQEKHIKDDASDRRHGYFVDVLKQVRQLLKPDVEPTMPETPSAGSDASSDPLSNRFAGLKIYEPSDKFLETPPAAPTQDKNVVYEAETSTTLYDALFAYTLLFNDLQVIRSHIEVIWKDYRDRALDLVAASIATDTAIDLAREVIEAAMPALEGGPQEWEGGLMGLVEKFFLYHVILRGHDPETTKTSNPKDNMNHAIFYDMEDEMYITAFRLLDGLNDVLDPDHMPLIGDHALPPYRPADRSRGGQFKMMQDQHLLMGVFTDLVVCNRSVKWIANDAFLREIKEMDKTGKVSFSLVFTAQIFLDIHHILGAEADRGLQDLIRHGVFIRREIDQHLSFHENLRIDGWPKSNDQGLRQCSKLISWVLDDPVGKTKNKYYNKYGQEPPAALRSFGLLRRCPVIAGIWLAKFRTEYNEIGIAVANAWGSIGAAAHLYNACQSERLLEQGPAWPDLDVTMTILGEDSFFVGGKRPRGVADCFKKACMQLGTSTSLVAGRQRRPNASTHSAAGPRGIKAQMGRVYRVFVERYSRCEGPIEWTPERIEEIVGRSHYDVVDTSTEEEASMHIEKSDNPRPKKKGKADPVASPGDLVRSLAWALQAETMELAFPFLHFHRHCWEFLRAYRVECDPELRKLSPDYLERENQLPYVVYYALMFACEHDMSLLQKGAQLIRSRSAPSSKANNKTIINLTTNYLQLPIEVRVEED